MAEQWSIIPEGWHATQFTDQIMLEGPVRERIFIPKPYDPQSEDWWRQRIEEAIREVNR